MPDLDPAMLAERVLRLSRSPPFDQMPVEDVTVLAAAGREQSFPTRTVLVHAGERSMAHYVPLAGRLQLSDHLVEATGRGAAWARSRCSAAWCSPLTSWPTGVGGRYRRRCLLGVPRSTVTSPAWCSAARPSSSVPPHELPRPPAAPTVRLDLVSRMLTLRERSDWASTGWRRRPLGRVAHARQFSAGRTSSMTPALGRSDRSRAPFC
jgi:hypothetical protein